MLGNKRTPSEVEEKKKNGKMPSSREHADLKGSTFGIRSAVFPSPTNKIYYYLSRSGSNFEQKNK